MNKKIFLLLITFAFASVASANMVWPALYVETKMSALPIIGLSLLIEFYLYKYIFQINRIQAAKYVVLANIVSGLLGLFLRPLSGIAYELSLGMLINWLFDWGTFNPVVWICLPFISGSVNAVLELLTIKIIWKHKFSKRNFYMAWVGNIVTVAIATAWVVTYPPRM